MIYLVLIAAALGASVVTLWALGCPLAALGGNLIDYLRWLCNR